MIIAIIPARGGSRRIPHKNLINFCGKPLVQWTIEQAKTSKLIDKIWVSTDDYEIASIAKNLGVYLIARPSELSGDDITLEQVGKHILDTISEKPDVIAYLQPTSPLRLPEDIDNAIGRCLETDRAVFSACLEDDLYLWQDYGIYSPGTETFILKSREKFSKKYLRENGSIYVVPVEQFIDKNSRYGEDVTFYLMKKWQGFEIDELEDVEI
jgi:CMP-N-acetylneuraminic acid synthetase